MLPSPFAQLVIAKAHLRDLEREARAHRAGRRARLADTPLPGIDRAPTGAVDVGGRRGLLRPRAWLAARIGAKVAV